jgi:hypothetical protein
LERLGWRTGVEPASARSQRALVAGRVPPPDFVGRRGLAPRSPGFRPGAITRLAHDPVRDAAPAEGIEPSKDRLTAGCLTIRLRWNETPRVVAEAAARGVVGIELSKIGARRRADESVRASAGGARSSGGRDRTCIAGVRGQRPPVERPRIVVSTVGSRRLGGDRTLASPVKSRVRYRYATSLHVRRPPPLEDTRLLSCERLRRLDRAYACESALFDYARELRLSGRRVAPPGYRSMAAPSWFRRPSSTPKTTKAASGFPGRPSKTHERLESA